MERMEVSDGALREGVIYDLLGRIRHEDVRDRTIATVTSRYGLGARLRPSGLARRRWDLLGQVREDLAADGRGL